MKADRIRTVAILVTLAIAFSLGACARAGGPPPIALGTACALCGMDIQDLRFACEQSVDGEWRAYDAIECLLRDRVPAGSAPEIYLADYDGRTLHAADSVWVVHGKLASPMGGGYASFLERRAADEVAGRVEGRVARLRDFRDGKEGS